MSTVIPSDQRHAGAAATRPLPRRDPLPPSLPTPAPLVGRERDVVTVAGLLADPSIRLVTLVGPGGVGKTRLAVAAAAAAAACFADGVAFVDLAPLTDHTLVPSAVAAAIGVREVPDESLFDTVRSFLTDRAALLVLDNCEHLRPAAALTADLLAAGPDLAVLATSRTPLHLAGEHAYPVAPLSLPGAAATPAAIGKAAAVRLFADRARAAKPDFALTERNAPAVAEICRRLDGLPLALELAAARVAVFPPAALLRRLEQRQPVALAGPRDAPARQRTLRDAMAWSHDLLAPEERTVFRRLAVFAGGFTLEAAEAVAERGDAPSVVAAVVALVEQSLLRPLGGDDGDAEPRYGLLETVREFALERLAASGEERAARRRHAVWCLALVERTEPDLWRVRHGAALDLLEAERDNLRAALAWTLEDDPEMALRLAAGLWQFWLNRFHLAEGRTWLERALAGTGAAPPAVRAKAVSAVGAMAAIQHDTAQAVPWLEESVALHRRLGARFGLARALLHLGEVLTIRGEPGRAETLLQEALGLLREPEDNRTLAELHNAFANIVNDRREHEHAVALHERALLLMRGSDDRAFEAIQLQNIGVSLSDMGDFRRAAAFCGEAAALHRAIGDKFGLAQALNNLSFMHHHLGESERALAEAQEALTLAVETGNREFIGHALDGVAEIAVGFGQAEQGARFLGAAEALRASIGIAPTPRDQQLRAELLYPPFKAALGEEALAAGMAAGRLAPLEVVIAAALAVAPGPPAAGGDPLAAERVAGLSRRERGVLRLVADGKSDREIADTLYISRPTASKHVASILAKLGVSSRAAAAAVAARAGLD